MAMRRMAISRAVWALAAADLARLSDRDLLERFACENDQAAFAEVVVRHRSMVEGVCNRSLTNAHDAEDCCQAVFLLLARKAGTVRWATSVANWLYAAARKVSRNSLVAAARRARHEHQAAVTMAASPVDLLSGRELLATLDEELENLSPRYREPLVLCCLEGLSRDEAAQRLGLPEATLKSRLERGRKKLADALSARGCSLGAALLAATAAGAARASSPKLLDSIMSSVLGAPSAHVAALLHQVALNGLLANLKRAAVALIGLIALGSAWAGLQPNPGQPQPAEQLPAAEAPDKDNPRDVAAAPAEHLDRLGDPLPADAVTRLGTNRFFSGEIHYQIAFSPDGGTICVVKPDGVTIFDAASGQQLQRLAGKPCINPMSLSPDGKHLALGKLEGVKDQPGCLQIWDLASGTVVRECRDTGFQQYLQVQYSADGKLLASYSSTNNTVYLWNPSTGKEIRRWRLDPGDHNLICLAFAPDSKTLIVGEKRMIHFCDTTTGKERQRIADHPKGEVNRIAASPDGRYLATNARVYEGAQLGPRWNKSDNTICLWDAGTAKLVREIEVAADAGTESAKRFHNNFWELMHFEFTPDSKQLITSSCDGVQRVWDVATGRKLRQWDASRVVTGFALSPGGKSLASMGGGNAVRLWDPATGKELREPPCHHQGVHFLALSPDGRTAATGGHDLEVYLWDTATGQRQHRLAAAQDTMDAIQFSSDGRTLITLGDLGKARVWDASEGNELRQFAMPVAGRWNQHLLSPDGKTWASDSKSGARPVLWDGATGKVRHGLDGDGLTGALGFSPDSGILYSWGADKKVRIWDVAAGKKLREFAAGKKSEEFDPNFYLTYRGCFSPDGNWFTFGNEGQALAMFDMATGTAVRRFDLPGLRDSRPSLAYSPNSRILAVGDSDGIIHLLEMATGKVRRRLTGHRGGISALLFFADGKRLISGSIDTTALIWDLTGRPGAKTKPLSAADLDVCWRDLGGDNAEAADRAIRRLAASPAEALPYLEKKLQPPPEPQRMAQLIADLDSDEFAVRDRAFKELEKHGAAAVAAYHKALTGITSAEVRQRLQTLLKKLEQPRWALSLERLRMVRALEAIELAGAPDARHLLRKLAGDIPEAFLTREAKAIAERLEQNSVPKP